MSNRFELCPKHPAPLLVKGLQLFKASVAPSAARVCTRKRVVNIGKKVTSWWNQVVKDAIRAKKLA